MWNNLRFFNGTDYELQLAQDADGIWEGQVYLPEVSTNLYETANLFIVEECLYNGDAVINKPLSPDNTLTGLDFSWENLRPDQSKDVIMYGMRYDGGKAYVKELRTQSFGFGPAETVDSQDANYLKTINANLNVGFQINIAVSSENAGIKENFTN